MLQDLQRIHALKGWLPISLSKRIHFIPQNPRQRIKNTIPFLIVLPLGENVSVRKSKRASVASGLHVQSLEHLPQHLEYLKLFLIFLFIITFLGY